MHNINGFTAERTYSNRGLETLHPTAKDISPFAIAMISRDQQQLLDCLAPKTLPLFLRTKNALDQELQKQTSIVNDQSKAIFKKLITGKGTAIQRFTEESALRDHLVSEKLKHTIYLASQGEDLTTAVEDLRKLSALRSDLAESHERDCSFQLLIEKDTFSTRMQSIEQYITQVSKLNTTRAQEVCASWERVKNEANTTTEWVKSIREYQLARQKQKDDSELEQLRLKNDKINIANTHYQQIEDNAFRREEMINNHKLKQIETNTARLDSIMNGASTLKTADRSWLDVIVDNAQKVWKFFW